MFTYQTPTRHALLAHEKRHFTVSVLAKRLAAKSVREMTYLVPSGTLDLNLIKFLKLLWFTQQEFSAILSDSVNTSTFQLSTAF